jgi:hypothetical protein
MGAAAAIILAAAFGCIRARLTAILLAFGYRTGALWVCASFFDCFGHRGLLIRLFETSMQARRLSA